MADPAIIASRRQVYEQRLAKAATAVGVRFGVTLRRPSMPANRYPDLYAAEQLKFIAEFLEELCKVPAAIPNRKERVSA